MGGRLWTDEEIDFLKDKWGTFSLSFISKKLKRTKRAVILKAVKLNLGGAYTACIHITAYELAKMLNVTPTVIVCTWRNKYNLPIVEIKLIKNTVKVINREKLMIWLENNQDVWSTRYLELYALGEEPEWLKEKRKKDAEDKMSIYKNKKRRWTKSEELLIIRMYKEGNAIKEIAKKTERTEKAISIKLQRLGV